MRNRFFRILTIFIIIITIPFPAYADYGPISIDSYYDDWEDKPHTEVYPGKNPPEKKINYVSLFRDESNVYVHVIFAHSNNQGIINMSIDLRTNLGDGDYFIMPDFFQWDEGMDSMDSSGSDTEQNGDAITETMPEEQNLLSGRSQENILIVADNEINTESPADESQVSTEEPADPDAGADVTEAPDSDSDTIPAEAPELNTTPIENPESDTTPDESTGAGIEPAAGEISGENQFSPETAEDIELEEEALNGNMNLNKPGFYGIWAFSVWNGLSSVGTGYYTRSEGEPDELELSIPLSSITPEYDGITEISIVIKKLGKQEIFSVGASTAPFIGIAAGAGIAMLSVGAYTYRKKRLSTR